ncbi:hypothetical protein [Membranihabitans marinus]|uniref:hypothetical protein n=1 Tax=Membranihabitans marinus TaxID=1227546 RepID=UPI001F1ED1C8|nr:hypothetical protein [Membranihabitans marinus]
MNIRHYITISFFLLSQALYGQDVEKPLTIGQLPPVFHIGEYENLYPELYKAYPGFLLSVTNNNMNAAFEKWLNMIYAMESHAELLDFDIKGLKIWINVFLDEKGHIDYFQYFKKPYSKNINDKELEAFFKSFIGQFKMEVSAESPFNHSGSASFPSFGGKPLEANK